MAKTKVSNLKTLQTKAKLELKKAKDSFIKHEKKVKEYTKKNPEKAILIAAGIGAALGAIGAAIIKRKK